MKEYYRSIRNISNEETVAEKKRERTYLDKVTARIRIQVSYLKNYWWEGGDVWLIHADLRQKQTQYCKAVILPQKKNTHGDHWRLLSRRMIYLLSLFLEGITLASGWRMAWRDKGDRSGEARLWG